MDAQTAFRNHTEARLRQLSTEIRKVQSLVEYSRSDTEVWREGTDALRSLHVQEAKAYQLLYEMEHYRNTDEIEAQIARIIDAIRADLENLREKVW